MDEEQIQSANIQGHFQHFLEHEWSDDRVSYTDKISHMESQSKTRLSVDLDDLRAYKAETGMTDDLAMNLIKNPVDYLPPFQQALTEILRNEHADYAKNAKEGFSVGISGNFGVNHVTPRCLSASFFGQMICLEGIVTKCYELRCKVVKSRHYNKAKNDIIERNYSDSTSISGKKTPTVYPKQDDEGNPLTTEFGLSVYEDYQKVTVQEMPEKAPAGQLPRSIEVILSKDLCAELKPGDRTRITGIYRTLPNKNGGGTSGVFRSILLANNIDLLVHHGSTTQLSRNDVMRIKKFANTHKSKVFNKLSTAIAPSICGHEYIKKAVLCQLMGGMEKNLENGTHIRGDINILLVGDPSTAKSQMLRSAMNISPLSIATTGRGSSGVGLTAAVLTDMDTGEKRLEAGAMVLGDRGLVCIDEFDKMSDADRVAIHEVMEQQTVTINKAGIHTALNARCSVLAAANPIYGQYRRDKTTMENVALPDSLLSRFDFLFIVLDEIDPVLDRKISEHVISNHSYRNPHEPDGYVNPSFILGTDSLSKVDSDSEEDDGDDDACIYQKHNAKLRGPLRSKNDRIVNQSFLKKYLHYAKAMVKPGLSSGACAHIAKSYAALRDNRRQKTLPITARTLETMIRLSTAIAKMRLSRTVTKRDANAALELMRFALYGEECLVDDSDATFNEAEERAKAHQRKMKKRRRRDHDEDLSEDGESGSEDDDSSSEEESDEESEGEKRKSSRTKRAAVDAAEDDAAEATRFEKSKRNKTQEDDMPSDIELDQVRFLEFQKALNAVFGNEPHVQKSDAIVQLQQYNFTELEVNNMLQVLHKEEKIYVHGDDIFRV